MTIDDFSLRLLLLLVFGTGQLAERERNSATSLLAAQSSASYNGGHVRGKFLPRIDAF